MARYSFSQLTALAQQAGFNSVTAPVMAAIALAESGGNPAAVGPTNRNGTKDYGLWQINSVHKELLHSNNWSDPAQNAHMAFLIWKSQGLKAWSTYNSGSYRKFLNGANAGAADLGGGAAGADVSGSGSSQSSGGPFDSLVAPFNTLNDTLSIITKLTLPQFWVRVGAGIFGITMVGIGSYVLLRDVRS